MSALIGIFGPGAQSARAVLPGMLETVRSRASGPLESFEESGVALFAGRHEWEAEVPGWDGPMITVADDWVIAADASLYYLDDLRRRLGIPAKARSGTGDLVLFAVRRWGDRFAEFVEGDLAIVAYDRTRRRVVLSRDFGGKRSLFYATPGGGNIVIGSSANAVVAHPSVSRDFDLDSVAGAAAGLFSRETRTAFSAVRTVLRGATLVASDRQMATAQRYEPPPFGSAWEDTSSERAAEELRSLLAAATRERLPREGVSTVLMSGGWDSPSIFALGMNAIRHESSALRLSPVTVRYPPEDRGNEDQYVAAVADRWQSTVKYIEANDIPLLIDDAVVERRDDPMCQQFEGMMRCLAKATRALGARIALDGFGGDQIFYVSSAAVLADHFYFARWWRLWQALRLWRRGAASAFAEYCVAPYLSRESLDLIGTVAGRRFPTFGERPIPPWIRASPALREMAQPALPRHVGESAAAWEARGGLLSPMLERAVAWNFNFAIEEGVQFRSPMFDRRVIEFAIQRPLSDRGGGPESKVLLRKAMTGLLPASALETRATKTGTTVDYFRRRFLAVGPTELRALFIGRKSWLERMGIVDAASLARSTSRYESTGAHAIGAALHLTLEAERWLAKRANAGY